MTQHLSKVYISYKHDSQYDYVIERITNGLKKNHIAYSIDLKDLQYKDNIEAYEKEIGQADRVIMVITPNYFTSLACMFEMSQIFERGDVEERVFPIVDIANEGPRDGNLLTKIKKYWQDQKKEKSMKLQEEQGNSKFDLAEVTKIDGIIRYLDDFWAFLVHINTGNVEDLTKDDAAMLIAVLQETKPSTLIADEAISASPTPVKPVCTKSVMQFGEKSVYIEMNEGTITIN